MARLEKDKTKFFSSLKLRLRLRFVVRLRLRFAVAETSAATDLCPVMCLPWALGQQEIQEEQSHLRPML